MSPTAQPLDEMALLRQEIAVLRTQIAWLQRQLFGPGKSEKLDRAQLLLKLAELEKLTASAEAPTQTITYDARVRRGRNARCRRKILRSCRCRK